LNRMGHGRLRRVTAEFRGDEAVALDILEVALRMGEVARTRIEADTMVMRLALQALDRMIAEYCRETGARYPSYRTLSRHLAGGASTTATEESNVVNLSK
jgi:hypothetical protein